MTFNDLIKKCDLKNKATSNIRNQQVLSSLCLNVIGIYSRDGPFPSVIGIVNLHPSKGTFWVCYIHETYFDIYGILCPKKLSKLKIKQIGFCLYSEYKTQGLTNKRDSYCANYCLYIIYLTKLIRIDFKCAVLNLCYQGFSAKIHSNNFNSIKIVIRV